MTPSEQEGYVYEGPQYEPEFFCPQCGNPCERLNEGYCDACTKAAYDEIQRHEFERRQWESLSPAEREARIREATR